MPVPSIFKNCLRKTTGNPRKMVSPAKAPNKIMASEDTGPSFCFVMDAHAMAKRQIKGLRAAHVQSASTTVRSTHSSPLLVLY